MMHAIMKMMTIAQGLEIAAREDTLSAEQLRGVMRDCAKQLMASAETASPKWGELTGLIRDLEKGK